MDKELFLRRLSRAARWRLPYQEAEDVIRDYRELLGDSGEEDFGDPVEAVRLLERPGEYRRWLAVFILLSTIALAAPVGGLYNLPFDLGLFVFLPLLDKLWAFFSRNEALITGLPLLGMLLAWGWFRSRGAKPAERAKLRRLLPALAVQLLILAWAWFLFYLAATELSGFHTFLQAHGPWSFRLLRLGLGLGGPLCGGLGVWGLVRARAGDRRYLAVYLFGLASAGLSAAVLALLGSISLDYGAPDWWASYARMYAGLTAAGLLGTGWALC